MSNIFLYDGKMRVDEEFLMSESLEPIPWDYGTDLFNKNWRIMYNDNGSRFVYTFFKKDPITEYDTTIFYRIYIDTTSGTVGFGSALSFDPKKIDDIHYVISNFSDDRRQTLSALKVFNGFMFILLEGIDKYNVNFIRFQAANPALGRIYKRATSNPFLNKKILNHGFEYSGEIDGFLTYKRI